MAESLRDRLAWQTDQGQILDADRRYLMMRADVLMGLFRELPTDEARAQALAALARSTTRGGGASTRAYFQTLGGDIGALLNTMAGYSAELGWGVWSFSAPRQDMLRLEVRNSPFAAGFGASRCPVCHPIAGILQTVGELALGQPATVEETACAAQGHELCTFVIQPASTNP